MTRVLFTVVSYAALLLVAAMECAGNVWRKVRS